MARYKPYDVNQVTLIPVSFPDRILPGSFEYALNELVDEHIDLGPYEARYENDDTAWCTTSRRSPMRERYKRELAEKRPCPAQYSVRHS
jgi:hypothetical protein